MPSNIFEFQADLAAFADEMDVEFGVAMRRVSLSLHDRIVRRTPVDTGRARSSWTLMVGGADPSVKPESVRYSPEEAAQVAIAEALQRSTAITQNPYREVWIANNLPYINRLNEGWSKQAPAKFVEISIAEEEASIG